MGILKAILAASVGATLMVPALAAELPSGRYDLVSLDGSDLPGDPAPTLEIDGAAMSGQSLCNSFSGQMIWKADGSAEPAMPLRATLMACSDGERQALDARLMAALGRVVGFRIDGQRLILTTRAGEIVGLKRP